MSHPPKIKKAVRLVSFLAISRSDISIRNLQLGYLLSSYSTYRVMMSCCMEYKVENPILLSTTFPVVVSSVLASRVCVSPLSLSTFYFNVPTLQDRSTNDLMNYRDAGCSFFKGYGTTTSTITAPTPPPGSHQPQTSPQPP